MNRADFPKLIIRTPPEIKDWLYNRAKENSRSATGELIAILKEIRDRDAGRDEA
ncbi:Arc family DNA-binding protein [Rhizobium laguerreae]|uniref:Arc family DNA-binding protein n=1 Tax=Rhizobium laguerreae TaxID=1076926 RepID=A0AB35FJZ2_9HYPH|nr:Arc family DNA-binding protein [Rhizobium laguerreae]MBY3067069.1 Arc family DNA-binding protein [Rhizobium laguerreae]MBY3080068.1 Arc family DNA-binding protein [Rhizobium laguerreae]